MSTLVVATRGSALAMWQANHVKAKLEADDPELRVTLLVLKTKGDKILDVPLAKVGGKGLFVKEIEEALLRKDAQLAVHSMKDVPAELEPGLVLAAISAREDAHDVLVSRNNLKLAELPQGAHVGTSSLRRVCQLHARRPDLRISALRGNVDTRLRKLDEGDYDAIVLAAAGLNRLGHGQRISERLPYDVSLPAIGQGALGLETRADDPDTMARVRRVLHDETTAACVTAERAFLARLHGGCQTPITAHAALVQGTLQMDGLVGATDGSTLLRASISGPPSAAPSLGKALADELLGKGAAELLAAQGHGPDPDPAGTA
jgi:hydroxymethylbilane synthase